MKTVLIRPSRQVDLPLISALEKSGDAQFREVGMERVADAPAPDPQDFGEAHEAGRLLAAVTEADALVGFVRLEIVDATAHVEQLSVLPDHQGRGVGAALLQAAEQWARSQGYTRMSLTTFRDVPWNGPYYARLGWVILPEREWGPELAAARQHERDLGLDQWPRQAMVKHLDAAASGEAHANSSP